MAKVIVRQWCSALSCSLSEGKFSSCVGHLVNAYRCMMEDWCRIVEALKISVQVKFGLNSRGAIGRFRL